MLNTSGAESAIGKSNRKSFDIIDNFQNSVRTIENTATHFFSLSGTISSASGLHLTINKSRMYKTVNAS